jgi:hypothetical protein
MSRPGDAEGRRVSRVALILLVVIAMPVLLLAAWSQYQHGPIRRQLRAEAAALQKRAVNERTDPTARGPVAERALADALTTQERVRVLGTSTDGQGVVRVELSLWTSTETGGFTFDNPTVAEVCLRVLVTPGTANGGYGQRGTVEVDDFSCPPRVPLAPVAPRQPPPQGLPQEHVGLAPMLVPPVYKPCYSGSGTCD